MTESLAATRKFNHWRDRVTWYTHQTIVPQSLRLISRALIGSIMHFEGKGFENIPSGPCILTPNHVSNFDVLTLGTFLPRYPFFMTKRELFKYPVISWVFRMSGAFPVHRGESDPWALEQAGRVLQAGQILCLFPEGTRSGAGARLGRGKSGAIQLALKYNAPVVPAAIFGTQHIQPGRARPKVILRVDKPLDVVAVAGPPPHTPQTARELTTLLMQRIAAMLPPEQRGEYA